MTFAARSRGPVSLSITCGSTKRATPACSWMVTPARSSSSRKSRVLAHVAGHLADAREQAPIVERRLAGADSVAPELPRLPHQTGRVGQRSHRHRPVVRGHSSELVAGDERRASSESRGAKRRDDARGPGADHDDIEVVRGHAS